jgi:hypothetical protein
MALISGQASAQTDVASNEAFRARVAGYMKDIAVRPLPPGDTLLTWHAGGPVLFHTALRDRGGVKAGMLRNDRMIGLADVRWSEGAPRSFHATWFTVKADGVDSTDIQGLRRDSVVQITRPGQADTTLALPSIPWAVADYGMEELLLPAFDSIGTRLPYRLAVLRPYGLKWDTLRVTERTKVSGRGWDVVTYTETDEQWRLAITDDQHFLWLRRSKHPDDEKHPLEGTALGGRFARLLSDLKPATQPSTP